MHLITMPKDYDDEKETEKRLDIAKNTVCHKSADGKIHATYVRPEKEKKPTTKV